MAIIKTKSNFRRMGGKKTASCKTRKSKLALSFVIIFLICCLSVSYIIQTSGVTAGNYDVEDCEKKLDDLKNENQNLMVELARLKSMPQLEETADAFNMVAMEKADYITSSGSAMAVR